VTDRAVQPEAPTTEAGRRLLRQWNPGHVNPRLVQTVLAIEAGARAASQERPQPSLDPIMLGAIRHRLTLDNVNPEVTRSDVQWLLSRMGVAQERPPIDVERLHRELWAEFGEMLSDDEYASIERIVARLAGGSVASPEPRDG
jgi:hypothetical protein